MNKDEALQIVIEAAELLADDWGDKCGNEEKTVTFVKQVVDALVIIKGNTP